MSGTNKIEPEAQMLVEELNKLLAKIRVQDLTNEELEILNQLSLKLSCYLPRVKNSSLFEIDDILYENVGAVASKRRTCSKETLKFLTENCYGIFYEIFLTKNCIGVHDHIVDNVFLQLLKRVKTKETYSIIKESTKQMSTLRVIGRYLKVIQVALGRHPRDCYICREDADFLCATLMLLQLNDPDINHPKSRRQALWLSEQCNSILYELARRNSLGSLLNEFLKHWLIATEVSNIHFVKTVLIFAERAEQNDMKTLCNKQLLKYFMSALDSDEKFERIKDFIKGAFEYWRFNGRHLSNKRFLTKLKNVFRKLIIDDIFRLHSVITKYQSIKLMKFVKRHGYGIGLWSYLPKDITFSSHLSFVENTNELMDKYFRNPRNFEATISDEPGDEIGIDYCYHGFMRGLQLLDILHTICLIIDDFVEIDLEIREAYINTVFMQPNSAIKKLIKNVLLRPSTEYPIHFVYQLILRKCPFMILSHKHESQMENLIKMMSGQYISTEAKEILLLLL